MIESKTLYGYRKVNGKGVFITPVSTFFLRAPIALIVDNKHQYSVCNFISQVTCPTEDEIKETLSPDYRILAYSPGGGRARLVNGVLNIGIGDLFFAYYRRNLSIFNPDEKIKYCNNEYSIIINRVLDATNPSMVAIVVSQIPYVHNCFANPNQSNGE